jgi:hypothetical protein
VKQFAMSQKVVYWDLLQQYTYRSLILSNSSMLRTQPPSAASEPELSLRFSESNTMHDNCQSLLQIIRTAQLLRG